MGGAPVRTGGTRPGELEAPPGLDLLRDPWRREWPQKYPTPSYQAGGSPWGVAQPAGFPAPLRLCVLNVCDCGLLQSGRPGSSGPRGADPCPLLFVPQLHPRDVACIGSMLSFEYLIQLCQSKEWSPLPPEPRVSDGQWRRGPGEEQETGREEAAATGRDPGPQGAAVLLPRRQGWTRVETAVSTRPPSALTSWACCLSASSCRCSSSCSPEVGELRA